MMVGEDKSKFGNVAGRGLIQYFGGKEYRLAAHLRPAWRLSLVELCGKLYLYSLLCSQRRSSSFTVS